MTNQRITPIEINSKEFREAGYKLIDQIIDYIDTIREKPVTTGETPKQALKVLGEKSLSRQGKSLKELIESAADLLLNHSLFNGHPKFFGYITSSATPIGALADLLAAAVNPNVGANILSPMATEIEKQTIEWLTDFIGLPHGYGGLMVSGGNMANFTGFLAGRTAKANGNIKENGLANDSERMIIYCATSTHTWIEKAASLFGHGSKSISWIDTDSANKINIKVLEAKIEMDLKHGFKPFMVIGTAGDVSTGVVDNLEAIGEVCKKYDLWFHVDGAYGMPAAALPEFKEIFKGLEKADSVAIDPHKWLYSPLEAGCILVKNPKYLTDTFSAHPEYYNFEGDEEDPAYNFFEYGLQNSRGFRALKVWLALQQAGQNGYIKMIREDIELARLMYELADNHPSLEAVTHNLSITTFRYVPSNLSIETEKLKK
ncbi:MAG: aminotransferase class V-fold PLP-dependent enzyme [Calditrichaceae bacterium]